MSALTQRKGGGLKLSTVLAVEELKEARKEGKWIRRILYLLVGIAFLVTNTFTLYPYIAATMQAKEPGWGNFMAYWKAAEKARPDLMHGLDATPAKE